jgi:hypothetical protein
MRGTEDAIASIAQGSIRVRAPCLVILSGAKNPLPGRREAMGGANGPAKMEDEAVARAFIGRRGEWMRNPVASPGIFAALRMTVPLLTARATEFDAVSLAVDAELT